MEPRGVGAVEENGGATGVEVEDQIDKQVPIEIESGASMLTGPLVAQGVRTPQGTKNSRLPLAQSNTLDCPEAGTGAVVWQQKIENTVERPTRRMDLHEHLDGQSRDRQGQRHIYMIAADGRLPAWISPRARADDRRVRAAYSRNWSLTLVDGFLYTPSAAGVATGRAPSPRRPHRVRTAPWPWRRT